MDSLIHKLTEQYPALQFTVGEQFCWSPEKQQIIYKLEATPTYHWKLLHEVGHALLKHMRYTSDIELLKLEVAAWEKAQQVAQSFKIDIDPDYIQDCLDTYRDWLHKRSTCPICGTRSLQDNAEQYICFNCHATWHVSSSRFCRTYRQTSRHTKKSPALQQATFS